MSDNKFYVYCLFRPWNLEPCYIGKGSGKRSIKHKFYGHRHYNDHLAKIFKRAAGSEIPCVILHNGLDEATAFEYERALIAAIGRADLGKGPLCNLTDGGDGCSGMSESGRKRISEASSSRRCSMETREKLSKASKGLVRSSETRSKISEALRKRYSEIPHPTLGRKHSDQTRSKIGNAHRGKIVSQESREKMSRAKTNISEETRLNMSLSAKVRCERQRAMIGA